MESLLYFLEYSLVGISAKHWLLAVACLAGGWLLRQILMFALRHILKLSAKTETAVDDILVDAISKPLSAMCFVLGVWAAFEVLPLGESFPALNNFVRPVIKAATVMLVIWFAVRLIDRSTRHMQVRAVETKSPMLDFVPIFRKTAKIFLVLVGVIIIVQDLGYSVASLIAGLGLGGLAIGLAAKDTLANFFGSVVIFVDRPFVRGDWIKVGEHEGIVEDIGVRVTRIRGFADNLITMPNSLLTTTAIINWTAMRKRRMLFTFEIMNTTPPNVIQTALDAIRGLIAADDRFDGSSKNVFVKEMNGYSLTIQVFAYTMSPDYNVYVAAQQQLYLAILRTMENLKIRLATPTQTLNVANTQFPSGAFASPTQSGVSETPPPNIQ